MIINKRFRSTRKKHSLLKKKDLIDYDLQLTLNTQLFLTHLKMGKLDPKKYTIIGILREHLLM